MAQANAKVSTAVVLPDCPVCQDTFSIPIFQCQSGHSICNKCTSALCPPICPLCRQAMTQMRNWQLEEIINSGKVSCPNKSLGCVYTMPSKDVDDHLKECIFRDLDCPIGTVFGKCSWTGKLKDMMEHFKERHPNNCNVSSDTDVNLENVDLKEDERYLYMVTQQKLLFIMTVKIDTLQKTAYWTIQHIGPKFVAKQHIYEIHITSNFDNRRKIVFIDHCFNDAVKADEVFRMGRCAVVPFDLLNHFIKDKKLTFRFFVKRLPAAPKKKNDDDNGNGKPNGPKPKKDGKPPGPKKGNPKQPGEPQKPGPAKAKNKANA